MSRLLCFVAVIALCDAARSGGTMSRAAAARELLTRGTATSTDFADQCPFLEPAFYDDFSLPTLNPKLWCAAIIFKNIYVNFINGPSSVFSFLINPSALGLHDPAASTTPIILILHLGPGMT